MDEIRFNSSKVELPQTPPPPPVLTPKREGRFWSRLGKVVLIVLALLVLTAALYEGVRRYKGGGDALDPNASPYYAVFLSNNQVYFGKLIKSDQYEMILSEVYYLQPSSAGQALEQTSLSLVKMGDEIHGPTDKLYINVSNVLFYEQLKNDSKVVQSINSKQ